MKVEQIYNIVNQITGEILGKTDLLQEDLGNIVDVGNEIFSNTDVDNYVKSLVDKIGKVIFVSRPYSGKVPSVLMDSWEYGAVVQKISTDLPDAIENKSWELEDGEDYSPNIFYKPTVSNEFYNNKVTFEIDMSFTERQVRESFNSASEINSFISMLYNAVDNSFTVKVDGLIMRTINNMIAQSFGHQSVESNTCVAIDLLKKYETLTGNYLNADRALTDKDFMRYATSQIGLFADRIGRISSLFNIGGKDRFTPNDKMHIVLLSEFASSAKTYLESDTFHNEFVSLPNAETVPYWQGSGMNYDFYTTSGINLITPTGYQCDQTGIIGVLFDTDALGVTNYNKRVTTNYNPRGEFYTNFYKMDCGAYNDWNENFIVFYLRGDTAS